MTQFTDLDNDLTAAPVTPAQYAAVVRLLATQPDADALATVLGLIRPDRPQPEGETR